MNFAKSTYAAVLWGAVAVICSSLAITARADVVYLKDGTILEGKVINQKDSIDDPIGGSFVVSKAGGFFAVADGVRIIIFSSKQLDPARVPEQNDFLTQFQTFERKYSPPGRQPPSGTFKGAGPFNNVGVRQLQIVEPTGKVVQVPQVLTVLNAHGVQLCAKEYLWRTHYMLSELDPKTIRELITQFPDMIEAPGKPEPDKRMKIYRFFVQAKRFDEAAKELDKLEKDVPAAAKRAQDARHDLRQAHALHTLDQAQQALSAGQFRFAQALLARIPAAGIEGSVNVKVNTLRVRVENLAKQWELAVRYLNQLPDEIDGTESELLCEAADVIRNQIHLEALDRLEPFISLAEQAERAKAQGNVPAHRADELLSLAATGWLLGKESAQTKPDAARKAWKARRFVASYLATDSIRLRETMLQRYQKDEPIELDEIARIISLLPPTHPDDGAGLTPLKRRARGKTETDYVVQLPVDYYPGRSYPVLIVLNNENERPDDILERYRYEAANQGFILVAADWSGGTFGPYVYSGAEHDRVIEVLHDLGQRFPVDSDRVFLSGLGQGANAAWDIGLSHPDLFAGVSAISSQPKLSHTMPMYRNAQNLPFYIVTGDLAGDAPKENQRIISEMISRGYPTLHCIYRGRGTEWFGGELPYIFQWMRTKRRYGGHPEMGRNPGGFGSSYEEYQSMRSSDNHFWWMHSTDYMAGHLIENKKPKQEFYPARFQGIIKPGNQVNVYTLGLRNLTLTLGPNMVDYTKPVYVTWTGFRAKYTWSNDKKPLQPSLRTMLEDLRERGDRQRLVYVRIELPADGR
jgi:hypothetical protein